MILGTEINEFVTNRQQSKIHFLQQENNQLQEYIEDLEQAMKLNKDAMRITIANFTAKTNDTTHQNCQALIQSLNEENKNLLNTLSKLQKSTTATSTKVKLSALLQEQISGETLNFYKDLIQDLEDKVIELKRNIHDKEYAIQELERLKPIQDKEGQLVKIIEVVTPSEQTLKMHEELENIRQVLNKITQEAQTISHQNKILKEVNYVNLLNLKREVYKLRIVLRSQVAHHIMKDFVYNEYIERTDQNLQLNHEIQSHRTKLEQLNSEMYGQTNVGYGFSPEVQQLKYLSKNERMIYQEKLHKMEMMLKIFQGFKELFEKEKQINQQITIKYNDMIKQYTEMQDTNDLLIRSNELKDEKFTKIFQELGFYKKQCNQYMEMLKTRRNFNYSIVLQQEQDIAVGVFSPRYTSDVQPNKQNQQGLFISNRKRQQNSMESLQSQQFQTSSQKNDDGDQQKTKEEIQNHQPATTRISKKPQLKQLIIPENDGELANAKNYCFTSRDTNRGLKKKSHESAIQQYYDMSLEECKEFLHNMAIEFNKNMGLSISNFTKTYLMNTIKLCEQSENEIISRRINRSNSDPFGYFSKDVEQSTVQFKKQNKPSVLATVKNKQFISEQSKNEIHMILEEIQQKKQKTKTVSIQNDNNKDPFSLDVSQINDKKNFVAPNSTRSRVKNIVINAELSFVSNNEEQSEDDLDLEDEDDN